MRNFTEKLIPIKRILNNILWTLKYFQEPKNFGTQFWYDGGIFEMIENFKHPISSYVGLAYLRVW